MEIEYLNSILYLQYNTIAEEAHSYPVCKVFFLLAFPYYIKQLNILINNKKYTVSK